MDSKHQSSYQQQQQQYQYQHYQQQEQQQPQHHNPPTKTTPQSIIQQLKHIYQQVIQQQHNKLNQLLNLQKLLNHLHSTTIPTRQQLKKNNITQKKQQQKKQFNLQRIQKKIQLLIDSTDQVKVIVQQQNEENKVNSDSNTNNNSTKNITINNTKKITIQSTITNKPININKKQPSATNKPLTYKLQPMPQKKPPIPTINRVSVNQNPNRIMNQTKYIPPRNKNQVTGKVTQTKILTQQKVFKPQINANSINTKTNVRGINTKTNVKINSSVQKRASNANNVTNNATNIKNPSSSTPLSTSTSIQSLQPTQQDTNSISQYKNLRIQNNKSIKLNQFTKPIQQLYQQSMKKKQLIKKKYNFKQLLQKYQQQEMGHKNLQQKRRYQYIKKLNNLGLSINKSNSNQITNSINKRVWKGYEKIFQFNQLLERVQSDIERIQEQYRQDLRSDPKQVYKLQCMVKYIERQVNKIMSTTQIQVPQKIQLSIMPLIKKQQPNNNNITNRQNNNKQQQTITLQPFYQQLSQLLTQTQQHQSLSTKDLSILRVIVEIILNKGKKSPLIITTDQFQQWKQSYEDVDDRQIQNSNQQYQ